jgi:hypothetical protein
VGRGASEDSFQLPPSFARNNRKMFALSASKRLLAPSSLRAFSTVPVKQIASVLKLNVANEANAIVLDAAVRQMSSKMQKHTGYVRVNRYVCKTEWAYELSFIFKDINTFKAWKTSAIRDDVHKLYLETLSKIGVTEDKVYSGARVYDEIYF